MCAEVSAPAHSHSREDRDDVVVDDAFRDESRDESEGGSDSSERRYRKRHEFGMLESEQPLEDEVDLSGQPRYEGNAFVCYAGITVSVGGAKRQHHDDSGDDEHARNYRHADAHAVFATVQNGVDGLQKTHLDDYVFYLLQPQPS